MNPEQFEQYLLSISYGYDVQENIKNFFKNYYCIEKQIQNDTWTPKKGEYCWFENIHGEHVLRKFMQMCPLTHTNYVSVEGMISGKVKQFIGKLPFSTKEQ